MPISIEYPAVISALNNPNFLKWLYYTHYNTTASSLYGVSETDFVEGDRGLVTDHSDEEINNWYTEYQNALTALGYNSNLSPGQNALYELILVSNVKDNAKTNSSGSTPTSKKETSSSTKKSDIKKDDEPTGDNNQKSDSGNKSDSSGTRKPEYYVYDPDMKTKRVLTDKEIEQLKKGVDPETGMYSGGFQLGDSDVIVGKTGDGDYFVISKKEIEERGENIESLINGFDQLAQQSERDIDWSGGGTGENLIVSSAEAGKSKIQGFDMRLAYIDGILLTSADDPYSGLTLVPFASNTVASCFADMVFTVDSDSLAAYKQSSMEKLNTLKTLSDSDKVKQTMEKLQQSATAAKATTTATNSTQASATKRSSPLADPNYTAYVADPDLHGVKSVMNPYAITRLYGALGGVSLVAGGKDQDSQNKSSEITVKTNRMFDIRDQRRFYDLVVSTDQDFLSITQPTTSNIIEWSNKDKWGRTPYSFQDFVFSKWWNVIPNNRLITLRKYAAPCLDNLNFEGMTTKNENDYGWSGNVDTSQENMFAPVATAVTYFGEGTGNTLKDLLSITTGLPWQDYKGQIWTVQGDQGSNESQVVDDQIQGGISGWNRLDTIAKDVMSFGKFVGLFESGGFDSSKDQGVVNKHYENMVDPYTEGPYTNRILGPVNKISTVKGRARGGGEGQESEDLKFDHKLNIQFNYVARPVGGINSKAIMLDIMANLLEIGSASAVFWGGAHRFKIRPQTYPWGGAPGQKGVMHKLYQGKVFGENGALHDLMKGVLKLGSDSNGNFSWDTITNQLKNMFQGVLGAIGQAINTITTSIGIGEETVKGLVDKGLDYVSGSDEEKKAAQEKGKKVANNFMNNTEQMLKSRMIKATTMPTINNMRALLIGSPVGNWHLTIGNPLNPIAVIGNLVCSDMQFNFSEEMGPDDFPLEIECKFTLEHGMPRDKDAISSMFNRGAGKIYNLPDSLRCVSDMETRVDSYTGGTKFRTGGAYISQASLMPGSTGAVGSMQNVTTGNVVNSQSATIYLPKFAPVIIPDSANWKEVKDSAYGITAQGSRAIFKANLATRKQLI